MGYQVIASYPRETVDFLPLMNLFAHGHQVTDTDGYRVDDDPVSVTVAGEHDRPTGWVTADVDVDGRTGVILDGPTLGRGVWKVWARVGTAVIEAGTFRLT